ncbi:energy transducer TonB [Pseudomonas abyssi]|jgi:protein TonB|uniref:Protein TonB n=1 Tax=Pseudomonas abyssi TaxID=170540 RepID=A0A2A3MDB2_9PSED|nr:energy transducer TonB [Pseudomonas abyssi]MAC99897.1 energy transducer TonB [Pseudomonadales bacterium]PBK02763.1 energy transducer TonB [Pseudomonas abyssi]|tara:strand:+ start:12201 stop:12878 length:678 start_codon:yes stop_codon:yes gene_type:complete
MRLLGSFVGALLVALLLFGLMLALIMPSNDPPPQSSELLRVGVARSVQESRTEPADPLQPPERPTPPEQPPEVAPQPQVTPQVPALDLNIDVPQLNTRIDMGAAPALPPLQAAAQPAPAPSSPAPVSAPPPGSAEEVTPLVDIPPEYPRRALAAGIEGQVTLQFTVNAEGRVENIRILSAEPPGVFERAARRAVSRWRFAPRRENGVAVSREVSKTMNFRLEGRR